MSSPTSIPSGWINGKPHHSTGADRIVVNPATDQPVATVKLAGRGDVDAAIASARAAQPAWGRATPAERAGVLLALAGALAAQSEVLIAEEVAHTGKPIRLATEFDVPGSIDNIEFFAGVARNLEGKASAEYSGDHTSSIRREPVGVIGTITPWNYPLQMAVWKVIPALAAGCAVVLKPAEITPLTTLTMARIATEAGLPDGVLNIIVGTGPDAGAHLAGHPGVDMVTFTGSSAVGRQVMTQAAATGARVQLELGGKAPFVVFDDADLQAAIHGAVAASIINGGQDCTAATRAIVAPTLYDEFVDGVADLMSRVVIGDPTDPATDLGSLISRRHREKVAGMVERARAAGARWSPAARCPTVGAPSTRPRSSPMSRRTRRSTARRCSDRCSRSATSPATTTRSVAPTTPRTASPRRRGRATSIAHSGRRARSTPVVSGSTITSRSSAKCRTAGTAPPASARTCRPTPSTSTC